MIVGKIMKTRIAFHILIIGFTLAGIANAEIELVGSCSLSGSALDVYVVDSYAYVVGHDIGIQVIDISDPTSPVSVGSDETSGASHNVVVEGKYAYAANRSNGLEIFDISVPDNPQFLVNYDPPTLGHDVFIRNDIVHFITCRYFSILDVFDPMHPTLIGELHRQFGDFSEFFVDGVFAFVVDYYFTSGLTSVNIADPQDPQIVGSYPDLLSPSDIFVKNNFAYVPTDNGLKVLDVSDPANPGLVSDYDSTRIGWRIFCSDGFAFLANQGTGLIILDISDPYNLLLAEAYTAFAYNDVYYYDGLVYALRDNYMDILTFTQTSIDLNPLPPDNIAMIQNYPNPFNAYTTIKYELPKASRVTIDIYDILGRRIETLQSGPQQAGSHQITWNAGDFSSGVYFYRIEAGGFVDTMRMVYLK